MNNRKYYPFERNHYFYGKLLTVRDFHDEQKYMNDKRRINNLLLNGAGVVSGLRVVLIDDKTISVEPGMALDYQGREIIVEESLTKKLNVIDGFEKLKESNFAYLCIRYSEEKNEVVHKADSSDAGSDFNRVRESYQLFLTTEVNEKNIAWLDQIKTVKKVIFDRVGLKITQYMPAFVHRNETAELRVVIEKKNLNLPISVDYVIQSDFLKDKEGASSFQVRYASDDTAQAAQSEIVFTLMPWARKEVETSVTVKREGSKIIIGEESFSLEEDIKMNFTITEKSPKEAAVSKFLEYHFDDVLKKNMDEAIYLAKFELAHRKAEYSILEYQWLPFYQFVPSNQMLYMLDRIQSHTPVYESNAPQLPEEQKIPEKETVALAGGTEEIIVDLRSKDKVYFSDEIAHGLGRGDVFIHVWVNEPAMGDSIFDQECSYFGNMAILEGTAFESEIPPIETAVIAYPENGTFRIAVKPLKDMFTTAVVVKWQAQSTGSHNINRNIEINRVHLRVEPDTITLLPREKYKFHVFVTGTEYTECRWSVSEQDGGSIDRNGIYEAPNKEGVYEIVAESIKYPGKKSTAFIVVREG